MKLSPAFVPYPGVVASSPEAKSKSSSDDVGRRIDQWMADVPAASGMSWPDDAATQHLFAAHYSVTLKSVQGVQQGLRRLTATREWTAQDAQLLRGECHQLCGQRAALMSLLARGSVATRREVQFLQGVVKVVDAVPTLWAFHRLTGDDLLAARTVLFRLGPLLACAQAASRP